MKQTPRFESEFLEGLAFAFRKRRKSLNQRAQAAEYSKVYELIRAGKMERLEIDLSYWNMGNLRLHAWSDRLIWLDARRRSKKGWEWAWTYEGRLVGDVKLPNVIEALEDTLSLFHEMDAARTGDFNKIWRRLIARGPQEMR